MKNVADVYPLAPMQEAMLVHAVTRPGRDLLLNQFCYEIRGTLDAPAFCQAWQQLVARHTALRTAFLWDDLKQALQVVRHQVQVPCEQLDWRQQDAAERDQALQQLLASDRVRGFDPSRAPLLRITLVHLSADLWFLVWSSHHLVLDRWCMSTVLDELFALYEANRTGTTPPLPEAEPFRAYVNWIQQQDIAQAQSFWRDMLRSLQQPTPLTSAPRDRVPRSVMLGGTSASHELRLSRTETDALQFSTRTYRVTLSILFQAAWALLINRHTGKQDVVFGATVSGRPPQLPGVETIVGSFINNLPVRVRLRADARITQWLQELQSLQHRRSPYEYVSVSMIHDWCGLASGQLFDSLLVWLAPQTQRLPTELDVMGLPGTMATTYALTLSIEMVDGCLNVRSFHDVSRPAVAPVPDLLSHLREILMALAHAGSDNRLSDVAGFQHDPDFVAEVDMPARQATAAATRPQILTADASSAGRETVTDTLLHDVVRGTWQEVLGVKHVEADDNFFDLGGNSILIARLHTAIEAALRKTVPLLVLATAPTFEQMVQVLAREDWLLKLDMVTTIRRGGDDDLPPLFCIASPEVNTVGYAMMARHLNGRRSVYVVQSPPEFDDVHPLDPTRLPVLAGQYIDAMRAVHDSGPYNLVGMCGGAHLAFEMAKQLQQCRESGFLGIINTWAMYTVSRLYHLERLRNFTLYYLRRIAQLRGMTTPQVLAEARRLVAHRVSSMFRRTAYAGAAASTANGSARRSGIDPWISEVGWASGDREITRASVHLCVFRNGARQYWRVRDRTLGWARHAAAVTVVDLPGREHDGILREPYVGAMAAELDKCLSRIHWSAR